MPHHARPLISSCLDCLDLCNRISNEFMKMRGAEFVTELARSRVQVSITSTSNRESKRYRDLRVIDGPPLRIPPLDDIPPPRDPKADMTRVPMKSANKNQKKAVAACNSWHRPFALCAPLTMLLLMRYDCACVSANTL